MRAPEYPYVTCSRHDLQRGFAVCLCVARGKEPVVVVEQPTRRSLGSIMCAYHRDQPEKTDPRDLVLICEPCAKEQGIERIGGRMKEPYR